MNNAKKGYFQVRTSKPFATISYNTDTFLQHQLNDLVSRNIIDFWCYINHNAEIDEKKDHKHLFIIPSAMIDTKNLEQHFIEPQLNDLPLRCMPFVSSKFDDWFLYSKHDAGYLLMKGQARKYHYNDSDFITNNEDWFIELKHSINLVKTNAFNKIAESVENGLNNYDICSMFPVQMIKQVTTAIEMCRNQVRFKRRQSELEQERQEFENKKND